MFQRWRVSCLACGRSLLGLASLWLSSFEARRDAVLNEANAIGTTSLRARLLPDPHRVETLKLLREYVQIRLGIIQNGQSLADLKTAVDRSNGVQEALWLQVKALTVLVLQKGNLKKRRLAASRLFVRADERCFRSAPLQCYLRPHSD